MAPSGVDAAGGLTSLGTTGPSWRFSSDMQQQQCAGAMRRVLSHALIDICEDSEISTPKQVSLEPHSPDLSYQVGQCACQGRSTRMEDRVLVSDLSRDPHFSHTARAVLMAVFDGHAGSEAADHLCGTLLPRLLASPCLAARDYSGALREALLEAERALLGEYCTSGTTALVVLLVDRSLHIANVGDCRAVVCDDAEARALTWDHKPTNNKLEKARLEASGARLTVDGYVELETNGERVDGIALSRALGGAPLKLAPTGLSTAGSTGGGNGSMAASPAMSPAASTRCGGSSGGGALAGHSSGGGGTQTQAQRQSQGHARGELLPRLSADQCGASPSPRPIAPSPFINYPASRLLDPTSPGGQGTGAAGLEQPPASQLPPSSSNPAPLQLELGSGMLSHHSASLAVSRQNSTVTSEASVVIAEPELFQYSIHQGSEFLILGSDGLWDKVRNQEAVTRVRRWLGEERQSVDEAAAGLVEYALKLGSHDNVSVVVLRFSSRPIQSAGAPRHANSALRRARSVAFMPDSNTSSPGSSQATQPLTPIPGEDCPMADASTRQ